MLWNRFFEGLWRRKVRREGLKGEKEGVRKERREEERERKIE